jgi:hypothetical protein
VSLRQPSVTASTECHWDNWVSLRQLSVTETTECHWDNWVSLRQLSVTETTDCHWDNWVSLRQLSVTETTECHWDNWVSTKFILWVTCIAISKTANLLSNYRFLWWFRRNEQDRSRPMVSHFDMRTWPLCGDTFGIGRCFHYQRLADPLQRWWCRRVGCYAIILLYPGTR